MAPPAAGAAASPAGASPSAAAATTPAGPTAAAEPTPTPAPAAIETFGPAKLTRLDAATREAFLAGEADEPIPVDIHYVQSNETRHDLFFEFIDGTGGAYIGVGSDMNFTMMAKMKAEYAFLLDIDYRVVDLQRMYEALVLAHEEPRALVDAWHSKNEATTRKLLEDAFASLDEKARTRILRGFATARETVYRHLERVIARKHKQTGAPTSWLSDPELYAHVRAMYQTGRVRMMPGNLAGNHSLRTVGAVCKSLGVPVRTLYMSNAEEYFKYTDDFLANIAALPSDESSRVLRTIYSKKWVHADLWAYQVQPLQDFQTRLLDRKNRSRNPMLRYAEIDGSLHKDTGVEGLTLVALQRP
ncbi:MAG: hypothetical protein U0168_20275 [Nannocystaceae bacterium]